MSTITDVAREAGVSVATVSRALRGLDRVSPETRSRVLAAAAKLNYVASPTATSLASGRTRVVGIITPFLSRWYFSTLVWAAEKQLRAQDHHALLFGLDDDAFDNRGYEAYDNRGYLTPDLLWKRVDGVISLNVPLTQEELVLLDRFKLPLVSIGTRVGGRPSLAIDERAAMTTCVEHLIRLGHRDIAYVGQVDKNAMHRFTPSERLAAYRDAMAAAGLAVNEDWVVTSDWTAEGAAIDVAPLLDAPIRPSAIVGASDEIAIGVREAALARGLSVPRDLSITGIDDTELAGIMGLTTVRQDVPAQGNLAVDLLLAHIEDPTAPVEEITTATEFITRSSTAPPA